MGGRGHRFGGFDECSLPCWSQFRLLFSGRTLLNPTNQPPEMKPIDVFYKGKWIICWSRIEGGEYCLRGGCPLPCALFVFFHLHFSTLLVFIYSFIPVGFNFDNWYPRQNSNPKGQQTAGGNPKEIGPRFMPSIESDFRLADGQMGCLKGEGTLMQQMINELEPFWLMGDHPSAEKKWE